MKMTRKIKRTRTAAAKMTPTERTDLRLQNREEERKRERKRIRDGRLADLDHSGLSTITITIMITTTAAAVEGTYHRIFPAR